MKFPGDQRTTADTGDGSPDHSVEPARSALRAVHDERNTHGSDTARTPFQRAPFDDARLGACVHCGLCLEACPTYLVTGSEAESPRGRLHLMRALTDGRLEVDAAVRHHFDACLGCRACESACPSGVEYGALIEAARPWLESSRPWPARQARRLLGRLLSTRWPRELGWTLISRLAGHPRVDRLARRLGSLGLARLAALDPLPRPELAEIFEPVGAARGEALLLTGCVADTAFRGTALRAARLLALAGVRVLVPAGQGCCGALSLHLGDTAAAERDLDRLLKSIGRPDCDWIVPMAAGCGAHLREAAHRRPGEPTIAAFSERVIDPLSLLARLGLPSPQRRLEAEVAIHEPCHLIHAQGVSAEVHQLLAAIPGLSLVPLSESEVCCGSAGTYNLTERDLSRRLLERKLDNVATSGVTIVVAANPGCLLQMRSGAIAADLDTEILHPLDLLARVHAI